MTYLYPNGDFSISASIVRVHVISDRSSSSSLAIRNQYMSLYFCRKIIIIIAHLTSIKSPRLCFHSPRATRSNLMCMHDFSSHSQSSFGTIQWKVTAIDFSGADFNPIKSLLGL